MFNQQKLVQVVPFKLTKVNSWVIGVEIYILLQIDISRMCISSDLLCTGTTFNPMFT